MFKQPPKPFRDSFYALPIRQKLFIVTVILTFITTGSFALVAYKTTTSVLHSHLSHHIQIVSQNVRSILSLATQNVDHLTMSIMANQDIQARVRDANHQFERDDKWDAYSIQIENELFKIILGREDIGAIFLLLDDGPCFSIVVDPSINPGLIRSEDLSKIKSADGDLVWLTKDERSKKNPVGRVFTDTASLKPSGVLVVFVQENFFTKPLETLQKQYGETFLLLSDDGTLMSGSDGSVPGHSLETATMARILQTSDDLFFNKTIQGQSCQIWVLPMPDYHCRLVSLIPLANMGEKTQALKINMALIGLVCWLQAALIGFFISRSIIKPINLLNHSIKKLSIGKTLHRVNWKSKDEIGLVVDTYNDMLERLETTKSDLIKSEKEYRSIFLNAQEGIFRCDKNGMIQKANPAMARILGYPSEKALIEEGKPIHEMFNLGSDVSISFQEWLDPFESASGCELSFLLGSGRMIYTTLNMVRVMDDDGEEPYYDGILGDITQEKMDAEEKINLQLRIQQAQRVESLGTLAGGIAHDFNNILSAMSGFAQLAMLSFPEGHQSQEFINQLIMASERAKTLIQQILTFSRKEKSEKVPIEISMVIEDALKLITATCPSFIEIRQNINANGGTVMANEIQIHQIVMNLCTNACHAMVGKGGVGVLEVTLGPVPSGDDVEECSQLSPGQFLRLTVSDNGHGMSPEILERIFDPYFTTKKIGEGTGMGLSTVHGIVKDHGGDIAVYSEPGVGTTFNVFLPQSGSIQSLING